MLNFTVGPVMTDEMVNLIGAEQIPYFRTIEFSELMFENERLMKKFVNAGDKSKVVFITGSGTASMEATVANVFSKQDKILVINGGSFGQRFAELCDIYQLNYDELKLNTGEALQEKHLNEYDGKGYTGLLVNIHETSTGVFYNINIISKFCKKNKVLLVVDAISSFLADPFNMKDSGVDVMITGSQKALACPPGISLIVLSERAIDKINSNVVRTLYLDLKIALKDAERGQTPFTPAVGILRQINARLKEVDKMGGVDVEIQKVSNLANNFRNSIKELPLKIVSESLSNAVTPLAPVNECVSAYEIFSILKDKYNIWVCPNGGDLKDKIFRVGHIGALTVDDNTVLVKALKDLYEKGIL